MGSGAALVSTSCMKRMELKETKGILDDKKQVYHLYPRLSHLILEISSGRNAIRNAYVSYKSQT